MTHQSERELLAWFSLDGRVLPGGYRLVLGRYHDLKPALQCVDSEGAPECTITHNLDYDLGEGQFHVRAETLQYASHVMEAIQEQGLAHPTDEWVGAGRVERYAQVWQLRLEQSSAPEDYSGCKHGATEEPHTCPYQSDIHGDDVFLCRCCDSCAHECAQDI